ncbi:unnamed protein product [Caenorhabditis sp. 36 PRJEB53466]|nr:unnamed protein product [Caenorhabditis sp. 36 PRJEB53466]
MSRVYLDNNATTPMDDRVKEAVTGALDLWANPSSNNEYAGEAAEAIQKSRKHLAKMFNTNAEGVVFTSGGTEANNWVVDGAIRQFMDKQYGGLYILPPHIITTNIEHPSISEAVRRKIADVYYNSNFHSNMEQDMITFIPVDPNTGFVSPQAVIAALRVNTCLVSIMLANNETGVLQPVEYINRLIREKQKKDAPFMPFLHSDVAQAAGKVPVDVKALGERSTDFAPKTTKIPPFLIGGNQESGSRSGTENTPMIVGLGEAARVYNESAENIESVLRQNRDHFEKLLVERLRNSHLIHFLSSPRLPNTSSVAFIDYPSHGCDLLEKCQTFYASTGAACHKNECSPILKACGIPFNVASKTVRISFGRSTQLTDIEKVVEELVQLCSPNPSKETE